MEYSEAKDFVFNTLNRRAEGMIKATTIKYLLACEMVACDQPDRFAEREAALHIRKMIAEGELEERMILKRLYYKIPSPCPEERTPC
jgi:hypothetical protein